MGSNPYSPVETDPPLLAGNSEIRTFATSRYTYPGIRVFYKKHAQFDALPQSPAPLPLLVCVHGLGGSAAQFEPLLTSLVHISSCLAIDLPGCGRSEFSVQDWDAYTPDALAELLELIIEHYRDAALGQGVVLIGHSMGTSLIARLASPDGIQKTALSSHVMGVVAICPMAGPPAEETAKLLRRILWIPGWLFDLWRAWDRRGGTDSVSVTRWVGRDADEVSKRRQNRYNHQSRTPVWRRMAWGTLPTYKDGLQVGGTPSIDTWQGIGVPVFLIAGAEDKLTPPKNVAQIATVLDREISSGVSSDSQESPTTHGPAAGDTAIPSSRGDHVDSIEDITDAHFSGDKERHGSEVSFPDPSTPIESATEIPNQPKHPRKVVKTKILPPPANHAMLYMPTTVRVLAGLISDFLACSITERLSLGWQLQYLSREGKWDVKNLAKWKKVVPVGDEIGPADHPIFRPMKTLREVDDIHCPELFVKKWAGIITDVLDISKDQPVYDHRGLERGGIHYHKFPTVSKIPPTDDEIEDFIRVVDDIRARRANEPVDAGPASHARVIGVHCHYGFNRTGYFIVCYLVERCGFSVQQAIDAFAAARPNGIRHSHFLDSLFVRYCAPGEGGAAAKRDVDL